MTYGLQLVDAKGRFLQTELRNLTEKCGLPAH